MNTTTSMMAATPPFLSMTAPCRRLSAYALQQRCCLSSLRPTTGKKKDGQKGGRDSNGSGRSSSTEKKTPSKVDDEKGQSIPSPSSIYAEFMKKVPSQRREQKKRKHQPDNIPKADDTLVTESSPFIVTNMTPAWGKAASPSTLHVAPLLFESTKRLALVKSLKGKRCAFAMKGHGVPLQLLQNHVQLAHQLLPYPDVECSFHNFHGDLTFDWMKIRSRHGKSQASALPDHLRHDMDLYLTVMNRLATYLGMVLHQSVTPKPIAHWNVNLLRGYSSQKVAPLVPSVEWRPRKGIEAPGYVMIRLQGFPQDESQGLRRKRPMPLTLVFDACFRHTVSIGIPKDAGPEDDN